MLPDGATNSPPLTVCMGTSVVPRAAGGFAEGAPAGAGVADPAVGLAALQAAAESMTASPVSPAAASPRKVPIAPPSFLLPARWQLADQPCQGNRKEDR